MKPEPAILLSCLVATIVLEWTVCRIILRQRAVDHGREIALINGLTFPLATLAIHALNAPFWPTELGVVAAETLLIGCFLFVPWRWAFLASVAANGLTAGLAWWM